MEPRQLDYAAETPARDWPRVRLLGLVMSGAAIAALTISVGMFRDVLPSPDVPGFGDIQKPLARSSIALGAIGAAAAGSAWIRNWRGRMEWLGVGVAAGYAALLKFVLLVYG